MEIKELRKSYGLTQKEFADKYSIPIRTLQEWEQKRSTPPSFLIDLILDNKNNIEIKDFRIKEIKEYKICIDNPFLNCNKIYPIQQKKVSSILSDCCDDKSIKKIIVFGSSVTNRCHIGSDVDIYFELKTNKKPLINSKDFVVDYWDNYMVDDRLLKEILSKGVVVYNG